MKKLGILLGIIACIFASCTNSDSTNSKNQEAVNHLLPNTVSITYEQSMIVPQEYFFLQGIDFKTFVSELKEKSEKGKIKPFMPMSSIVFTKNDIVEKFGSSFNLDEMKHLLFEEEWFMDTTTFIMKKKVTAYTLIREYMRKTSLETEELTKSMIARYDFSSNKQKDFSKLTLLKKNVSYEVPLVNPANPEWLENIQVKHVISVLLNKVLTGKEQAYSFMLRDTLTKLTKAEVKNRLGEATEMYTTVDENTGIVDTVSIDKKIEISEIVGLAFIEDWYIDKSTMQIYKDVKGISLVREYTKYLDQQEPELARTIPFVVFFSNHKEGK